MRIKNTFLNTVTGVLGKLISLILGFVSRTLFIYIMGQEYLGLNGLFTNILSMLSLAELGFGSAVVFSLYKPIHEKDTIKIQQLMCFYKSTYRKIGMLIGAVGIILLPFLRYIVNFPQNVDINFQLVYILFLLNNVSSYLFFGYRRTFVTASQKQYMLRLYDYMNSFILCVGQILILLVTHNYILYLITNFLVNYIFDFIVYRKIGKSNPYLNEKVAPLELKEKKEIYTNVRGLFLYKIGNVILNATDNIIISAFVGTISVGLCSNYIYIITTVNSFLAVIFDSMIASVGDLNVGSDKIKKKEIFNKILFINFWIYGFCFIAILCLSTPFINIWIGEKYILDSVTVGILAFNFLLTGLEYTAYIFRTGCGKFTQMKYRPLIAALINLTVSVLLVQVIGIKGVFLGTTVSRLLTYTWADPYIVFKWVFEEPVREYFKVYLKYFVVIIMTAVGIKAVVDIEIFNKFIYDFLFDALICGGTVNGIFYLIFRKNNEFKYFITLFNQIFSRIKIKRN